MLFCETVDTMVGVTEVESEEEAEVVRLTEAVVGGMDSVEFVETVGVEMAVPLEIVDEIPTVPLALVDEIPPVIVYAEEVLLTASVEEPRETDTVGVVVAGTVVSVLLATAVVPDELTVGRRDEMKPEAVSVELDEALTVELDEALTVLLTPVPTTVLLTPVPTKLDDVGSRIVRRLESRLPSLVVVAAPVELAVATEAEIMVAVAELLTVLLTVLLSVLLTVLLTVLLEPVPTKLDDEGSRIVASRLDSRPPPLDEEAVVVAPVALAVAEEAVMVLTVASLTELLALSLAVLVALAVDAVSVAFSDPRRDVRIPPSPLSVDEDEVTVGRISMEEPVDVVVTCAESLEATVADPVVLAVLDTISEPLLEEPVLEESVVESVVVALPVLDTLSEELPEDAVLESVVVAVANTVLDAEDVAEVAEVVEEVSVSPKPMPIVPIERRAVCEEAVADTVPTSSEEELLPVEALLAESEDCEEELLSVEVLLAESEELLSVDVLLAESEAAVELGVCDTLTVVDDDESEAVEEPDTRLDPCSEAMLLKKLDRENGSLTEVDPVAESEDEGTGALVTEAVEFVSSRLICLGK